MNISKSMRVIDKPIFFGALFLLVAVAIPLIVYPEQGAAWVGAARGFLTSNLGVLYLALGVGAGGFMLFLAGSDIGNIVLGPAGEKPEFSTLSWSAMLFCAGIGAPILYWSMIEWAFYLQDPPFLLEPGSVEAARWASAYGIFHWGPLAWSIYLIPALPIAYIFHVRKTRVLRISEALLPILGERHAHGVVGKIVDVLFIFGMLGGGATALGFSAPLINEGAHELFGAPRNAATQIVVLVVVTLLFSASAVAGLKKGIQTLSRVNFWLAILLLVFVFVVGPTVFILETGLEALGRVISNIFTMATWFEPFGQFEGFEDTPFPQDWTIFYWAWWLAFAPSVGIFIARISRGRSIRAVIVGTIFYGTLGCFLFFSILGNYGMYLQMSGEVDVLNILNTESPTAAIFAILNQLPMRHVVVAVYTALALVFAATTFDSISYILASAAQKQLDGEPMRWNRIFWACALSVLPIALLMLGGLESLQTASIVGGAPLLIIALLLCVALVKVTRRDLRLHPGHNNSHIYIDATRSDD